MKTILLFVAVVISHFFLSQTIDVQDFNSLTLGNIGTNTTGTSTGQANYYLLNGSPANYQIAVVDAAHGQSAVITAGPGYVATNDPNNHFLIKLVGVNATPGNNFIKMALDFYTGSANGAGSIYMTLYDDGTTPAPLVAFNYNVATKVITAAGTLTNSTGTRGFYGIKQTAGTYPPNTWVHVEMTYNMTTGAMSWVTPNESYTFATPPAGYSLIPLLDVGQYRSYNINATGNSVAYNWAIDNINLQYVSSILGTSETSQLDSGFSVAPNPAVDVLKIYSKEKIRSSSVYDASGKKVMNGKNHSEVDVSSLLPGNYIIVVELETGTRTAKFIKK